MLPEEKTWELRQLVTHRRLLAKHRIATRNAICGIVHRKLLKAPMKELFGPSGRRWLLAQDYTPLKRLMLDNNLAHLDTTLLEIASLERDVKLLMTTPGVNVTVAIGLVSAIGDITRFASPEKLAAYIGLVPRVYQSAETCYHGPITKQGRSDGRWLAVEAAQSMLVTATLHRVRRKTWHNVAIVALARKLVVVVWHLLTDQELYRYAQTKRTCARLRRVTPGVAPTKVGCVPDTLQAVYAEVGLPPMSPPTAGEERAAANSRRTITRYRKARGKEQARG